MIAGTVRTSGEDLRRVAELAANRAVARVRALDAPPPASAALAAELTRQAAALAKSARAQDA